MPKQLFLSISLGFRQPYLFAILAMVISYIFLFMLPLISRTALDILLKEPSTTGNWLTMLASAAYTGDDQDSQTLALLLVSATISILLTALAGVFFYLFCGLLAVFTESNVTLTR